VLHNWENLKAAERSQKKADPGKGAALRKGILSHVPRNLPALLRAQRLQEKAARVGFDWPTVDGVLEKIEEEVGELREALKQQKEKNSSSAEARMELGDVLFSVVNLARYMEADAEECLRTTCSKFQSRFEYIEAQAAAGNRELKSMTLEEMDALWNEAKGHE
jgi:MazG family protein